MRKYILLTILLSCLHIAARGQTLVSLDDIDLSWLPQSMQASAIRYWFDDDAATINTIAATGGTQVIDASQLVDGVHSVHFQVIASDGSGCHVVSALFLKSGGGSSSGVSANKLLYWFDDETTIQQADISGGIQLLDASELTEGLHTLHYQVLCNNGQMMPAMSSLFMRMNFDAETAGAQSLRYWFDDDASTVRVTDIGNGSQVLDVSDLITGLHTLNYQLIDSNGKLCVPMTRFFFKNYDTVIAVGTNCVTKYQYWMNKNSQAIQTVVLTNTDNPYSLIALLPMQHEPIHSDNFHFEVTNGVPAIYARNNFHIRFYDAQGYFTDGEKPFVDYSLSQAVIPVGELQTTQTFSRVSENDIRWYSLTVEQGDTVAFKTSQACSIQLFAPSGEEVYNAMGSTSVSFGGCHTWESGTYYLAIHDVTGSQSQITLDYMHMDKYDVVRQDVSLVGNGGCSTITFEGNGFRDLLAVDLYNVQGDTIHSEAIGLHYDAVVSVTFDFTDKEIGYYDALFHFTTEDKQFPIIITIEDAKDIELALDVKYPSTFLSGTSTTYAITVTNKGNATAYDVPIEIYLSADGAFSNIEYVRFKNEFGKEFDKFTLDEIYNDSLDIETIDEINEIVKELDGLQSFIILQDSMEGEFGITEMMLSIPPKSSITYYVEIKCPVTVKLYTRIPSEWLTISSLIDVAETRGIHKSNLRNNLCCQKEKWECRAGLVADVAGFFPGASGCIAGLVDSYVFLAFEFGCADGNTIREKWDNYCNTLATNPQKRQDALGKSINTLISCITLGFGKFLDNLIKEMKEAEKCLDSAWRSKIASEKYAREAFNRRDAALKEFDQAVMLGDMDLAGELLKKAENEDKVGKMYAELAKRYEQQALEFNEQIVNLRQQKNDLKKLLVHLIDNIANGIATIQDSNCLQTSSSSEPNCPSDSNDGGGSSSPVNSCEPNDILGYVAESGSHSIKDGLTDLWYTIQFENDTVFATAPAHDIYLTDTLDVNLFDLSTYRPTRITIGKKSMELTGERNFISTLDMRPEIYAIAQIEGTIDDNTGIVRWHISSLDPMTMEPIEDAMTGVLPVNYDGSGMGEASYEISLKPNLPHGTEIPNRSGNIFDNNETVMTPTYINIIDRIAPESHVANVVMATDSTAAVSIAATDELSGPWRYNVYVQYGSGAWFLGAENVPIDKAASVRVYEGINHGFYTVVTDSAGNVEQKDAVREYTLEVFGSQVKTNTQLALAEGWNWISQNQQEALSVEAVKPKAQRIVSQTEELYKDARLGWSGDLEELLPTEMYKVQMTEGSQVQLSGLLFNAAFRSVPLREGWNWMGYPVAHTMTPAEALAKLEAEEGDILIGQDGMAQFSDGQWTGTLTELQPGQGYMYYSVSDKNLFLNATAQSSSRRVHSSRFMVPGSEMPEGWTVNKRKYPNVMGMVCDLYQEGTLADHDEWLVGAFCGDECRGLSQTAGGHLMMNIYGQGGEEIVFLALHRGSGEVVDVIEVESFRSDVLGTLQQPYELHSGTLTGIAQMEGGKLTGEDYVYDLQGRRVKKSSVFNSQSSMQSKGVYIMTDGKKSRTRKVVRK